SSLATLSAWSRLRAYMTATCAPSCASAWQMRCPSPPLPPVTSATTPFRSIASVLSCQCAFASPPLLTFSVFVGAAEYALPSSLLAVAAAERSRDAVRILNSLDQHVDAIAAPEQFTVEHHGGNAENPERFRFLDDAVVLGARRSVDIGLESLRRTADRS